MGGLIKGFKSSCLMLIAMVLFMSGAVHADWAHAFVVYDGNIYVISEEQVDPGKIGSKLGEVTRYSDREGTYSGNFSNTYPKGTEYYEINETKEKDAIAIKEKAGTYRKALYNGKYAGNRYDWQQVLVFSLLLFVLLFTVSAVIIRSRRSRGSSR
ncbi:hypothetical protein [Paenibacillus sp. GCM10027626]|uniref:hypothetical protein n=1 Tax=Paenibacillus sp. GCM10027626 TaxID=3273411 RepID=UPI003642FAD5